MLKAFDLENQSGSLTLAAPVTFKIDFNKMALPCWPNCTKAQDQNRIALYDYNIDTNVWTRLSTIVDWDNNQMWADLNKI